MDCLVAYNASMSEADRLKEVIGWLKVVFALLVAIDVSLVAWLVQNYQTASSVLLVAALVIIVAIMIGIVGVNRTAFRIMSQLRNM